MGVIQKILGPKSKYDKTIPYTYEARIPVIEGEDLVNSYFADTICGLIEYLAENDISSNHVQIYNIFQGKEELVDISACVDEMGNWLHRPEICESMEKRYRGHVAHGECSYDDRDRSGSGPY